ncbi:MAG: hypothetical protein H6696_11445 [Deferribacteres bacterium]|nr:hypothetical protein [candidate division KSB1 bacterium]MCB9502544.1 hypothetical protein [Deferribacteres bacterium]
MTYNIRFFPVFFLFAITIYFLWNGIIIIKTQEVRKPFHWRNENYRGHVAVGIGIVYLVLGTFGLYSLLSLVNL